MKLSPLRLLDSYREWRQTRSLLALMHGASEPVPPAGLKERLIEQALDNALVHEVAPASSRGRLGWAAVASVGIVAMIWLACRSFVPHSPVAGPSAGPQPPPRQLAGAAQPKAPASVPDSPRVLQVVRQPRQTVRRVPHRTVVVKGPPRTTHHERPRPQPAAPEEPVLTVSVTREPEPAAGYAHVAVYNTDDTGREVQSACTLIEDPDNRKSEQIISAVDSAGRKQLLQVTVYNPHTTPKENNYESL